MLARAMEVDKGTDVNSAASMTTTSQLHRMAGETIREWAVVVVADEVEVEEVLDIRTTTTETTLFKPC